MFVDGFLPSRPRDAELCAEARRIVEGVDWDCEVTCDFSTVNLGPHHRVVSGLNAAFQQVEELIVLEDDCVPTPTFSGSAKSYSIATVTTNVSCTLRGITYSAYFANRHRTVTRSRDGMSHGAGRRGAGHGSTSISKCDDGRRFARRHFSPSS